jgi:hypothetical protein
MPLNEDAETVLDLFDPGDIGDDDDWSLMEDDSGDDP